MPRRTLGASISLSGAGLHTGAMTEVQLQPAQSGAGIVFVRSDLPGNPRVRARMSTVHATERRTALANRGAVVDTVEHLLAAAHACELDDLLISLDGPEPPILDGSFLPWFEAMEQAGVVDQPGEPARVCVASGFSVTEGDATYQVSPGSGLSLTATVEWAHPVIGRQSVSFAMSRATFATEIAPARTFGFLHEIEALRQRGLLQGATPDMAIVLSHDGIANGQLRWADEFARHKLGDILGDLALLGARIDAQVTAERPSHQGNIALARAIARKGSRMDQTRMDIQQIMKVLPHRYPFLLVDRIVEVDPGERIVGIKNVTINEPFFAGHFPGHPIMPGVLIVEAMAQVGGMMLIELFAGADNKVVYFTSLDGVRFRKPVRPGDQLRFEVEMVQVRGNTCRTRGTALVDGQVVCEVEKMMATVLDR